MTSVRRPNFLETFPSSLSLLDLGKRTMNVDHVRVPSFTVNVSNFGPHGNLGPFLASSVGS
jgi:hypothetical protein